MSRKCFSSLHSSYVSVYFITAIFAMSVISLLYLKYPQEYINQFDFRIIKLDATSRTTNTPLSIHDLAVPYVNALREVVNPVMIRTMLPGLTPSPPPVVNIPAVNPPVELRSPSAVVSTPAVSPLVNRLSPPRAVNRPPVNPPVDSLSPPRAVNTPPVNPPVDSLSPPVVEVPAVKPPVEQLSPPPVVNTPAVNPPVDEFSPPPAVKSPVSDAVNKTEQRQNEDVDDEDEDESTVIKDDQISSTPNNFNEEQRMNWIKQKIPESIILESTTRTRKFDLKLQQYIRAKQCKPNIFMTWISSTSFFGKREMFCLESVLQTHPHACVIIVSRIMATKTGQKIIQPLLDRGHMILTIAPDFPLLFNGTPAQSWFERLKAGQLDPGKISITQNLSNLLRLVILYKYGGIYLDTDMIILKNLSGLRNSIGVQEVEPKWKKWTSVNNAVLIFDKDHPLLLRFMEEFNSTFDGNIWGYNGPYMATRVIKKVLGDPKYKFDVMPLMTFYPVDWRNIQKFFRNPNVNESSWDNEMFQKVNNESYGVHLWNKLSRNLRIEKGSIIGKLISTHCIICQGIYDS